MWLHPGRVGVGVVRVVASGKVRDFLAFRHHPQADDAFVHRGVEEGTADAPRQRRSDVEAYV
jgi:hypothetical protein